VYTLQDPRLAGSHGAAQTQEAIVLEARAAWGAAIAFAVTLFALSPASAESLVAAMSSAYVDNTTLNSVRAQVRAIDEDVSQALSGFRPQVSAAANAGVARSRAGSSSSVFYSTQYPRGVSVTVDQPLFLGFRTINSVKEAKKTVGAAREQLRGVEQQTLLDTVTAFMNVLQAQVVLNLNAQNVQFLREQVRAATDRMNVGEGTKTDVAQTNASLAAGISSYNAAIAGVNSAIATYEQVVGHKPKSLGAVTSVDGLLPNSMEKALDLAVQLHPSILSALYTVDVAAYNVKVLEGAMLPSLSLQGSLAHADDSGSASRWSDQASLMGQLSVPLYEGGAPSSRVRQAKETEDQRQLELDTARANVRQQVISAWGALDAAKAQVTAAESGVSANQLVLSGVIEEQKVGQKTTLDVLNAQQSLLTAKEAQAQAQHDRVVAAYTLLAAIGRLNAEVLRLKVAIYDPTLHYDAVKDKWFGLRTPEGR
jgi:outer membrane protein